MRRRNTVMVFSRHELASRIGVDMGKLNGVFVKTDYGKAEPITEVLKWNSEWGRAVCEPRKIRGKAIRKAFKRGGRAAGRGMKGQVLPFVNW